MPVKNEEHPLTTARGSPLSFDVNRCVQEESPERK